jgi:hypothetical protein
MLHPGGCGRLVRRGGGPDAVRGSEPFSSTYVPAPAPPTLVRGATRLTGTGERRDGGGVLIVDGRIAAVGSGLEALPGACAGRPREVT